MIFVIRNMHWSIPPDGTGSKHVCQLHHHVPYTAVAVSRPCIAIVVLRTLVVIPGTSSFKKKMNSNCELDIFVGTRHVSATLCVCDASICLATHFCE